MSRASHHDPKRVHRGPRGARRPAASPQQASTLKSITGRLAGRGEVAASHPIGEENPDRLERAGLIPHVERVGHREIAPVVRVLWGGGVNPHQLARSIGGLERYVSPGDVFAVAVVLWELVAGTRPIDPDWGQRPRNIWQQYELRLERLDVRFDERLKELYDRAVANQKWRGTSAVSDRSAYWAAGVLAYFDARGQDSAPAGTDHPIITRQGLKQYDADLYALVHETFAYGGRVDWRFQPGGANR